VHIAGKRRLTVDQKQHSLSLETTKQIGVCHAFVYVLQPCGSIMAARSFA